MQKACANGGPQQVSCVDKEQFKIEWLQKFTMWNFTYRPSPTSSLRSGDVWSPFLRDCFGSVP